MVMNAMVESGMPSSHPDLLRAAEWLLDKRGHGAGDWRIKNRKASRPGWFFEYANPFYPDNDTTAKVVTALSKVRFPDGSADARRRRAIREAHEWQLTMQNSDGGWAAFDKNCDKELLTRVPFADHNAMIDPSNEDITGRVLETFACLGFDSSHPPARRAIDFLLCKQVDDGSWFGRWGCNYLYGTWLALWGLSRIGVDMNTLWARRAVSWIETNQNEDGGWGELPLSYDQSTHKGRGPSTASQTAWALLGLMSVEGADPGVLERGIAHLLCEQHEDGSWQEEYWTGTGFPGVFYLRYHLYGVYFPLLALSYFSQHLAKQEGNWTRSA
jgi:squalene-hopene/tetraprenyl-beta-curcumene cyclase